MDSLALFLRDNYILSLEGAHCPRLSDNCGVGPDNLVLHLVDDYSILSLYLNILHVG